LLSHEALLSSRPIDLPWHSLEFGQDTFRFVEPSSRKGLIEHPLQIFRIRRFRPFNP